MLQSFQQAVTIVREDPSAIPSVLRKGIGRLSGAGKMTISSRMDLGYNVYNEDWDLLIILDTCRVDALRHFATISTSSETVSLNQKCLLEAQP